MFSLSNDKGMSLMEIMVAMVLFAIGVLSLGTLIPQSTRKLVDASARTTAVTLAQRFVDDAVSKAFDEQEVSGALAGLSSISPSDMTPAASLGPDAGETVTNFDDMDDYEGLNLDPVPNNAQYAASVSVRYCTETGDSTSSQTFFKRITVTVTPKGGEEPVAMSTILSFKR